MAATQVLYGHSVAHLSVSMPDAIGDILGFFKGVPIFFILSGYLIWMSVGRSKSYKEYLCKRFWRICPELWVAVLIELLVLSSLYEGPYNLIQTIAFVFGQLTIFQFWTPACLRDYGCGVPNGALWTISVLIQFYIIVWFIYKRLHNTNYKRWFIAILLTLAISFASEWLSDYVPTVVDKLYRNCVIPYLWMFVIAAFFAEYKDRLLPILTKYWIVFLALAIIVYVTRIEIGGYRYGVLSTITLTLSTLAIAYAVPQINVKTDISYGLYIYHMTVVNAMIILGMKEEPKYIFVTIVVSAILAYCSTKSIGAISKKMKNKI